MQVRALKSFSGRYGHIRVGQIFHCVPNYAADLLRQGLVEKRPEPGPADNRSIPGAPAQSDTNAGKDSATGSTERAPAGGEAGTPSSLRAVLASRKKTPRRSKRGASDPASETAT